MHTCNTLHTGHTVLIHYCLTVAHVLDGLIAHIIRQCATKLQLNSSTDERGGAASEAANLASHELQPSQAAHNHDMSKYSRVEFNTQGEGNSPALPNQMGCSAPMP